MIEAGVDLNISRHPHLLKGIEIFRGKPIFYSLGNFAIEQPSAFVEDIENSTGFQDIRKLRDGWKVKKKYMTPPDTRYSLILECLISKTRNMEVSLLPCYINDDSEPEPLEADNPIFADWLAYLKRITESEGLDTGFTIAGNRVKVQGVPPNPPPAMHKKRGR